MLPYINILSRDVWYQNVLIDTIEISSIYYDAAKYHVYDMNCILFFIVKHTVNYVINNVTNNNNVTEVNRLWNFTYSWS